MADPSTAPQIAKILDFIAGGVPGNPSGESDGNYNAQIGSPHATEDLGTKTLVQIFALQQGLEGREPSSAIGRYQFILPTLRGLVAQAKVPLGTLFSPALQDQFATILLRTRGLGQWQGGGSNEAFVHGLSCEWASLPDPFNGGRSHYDGVAGNHASTTLEALYDMLDEVRAVDPGENPAIPSATPAVSVQVPPSPLFPPPSAIPSPKALQTALAAAGFYRGPIDGIWGPASVQALSDYYLHPAPGALP